MCFVAFYLYHMLRDLQNHHSICHGDKAGIYKLYAPLLTTMRAAA